MPRNVASRALVLAAMASGAACGDTVVAGGAQARLAPAPLGWELTPLQQQLLMHPVSPRAAAGRPATRADLEAVRGWFGPGELEALLGVVNRGARARGTDTLPHCLPLCSPAPAALEHTGS